MLGGFDPRSEKLFFQRRYGHASLASLIIAAAVAGWAASQDRADAVVEVELQPEIEDFAVEEEKPEEEEPPPPPPPDVEVKVTQKPKPKPKIKPPDQKPQEAAPESTQDKVYEHPGGPSSPGGIGTHKVDKPKPQPKPEVKPKPEAKPKPAAEPIDPTKPIDRPEKATMPKPDGGNKAPAYPEALRDQGITGEVVVKIHIHRDGTVKGAKILRKKSSATTEEEKAAAEKAFVAAVIAAVRNWKYEPAKLDGEPISIWFPVTLPFTLTGG